MNNNIHAGHRQRMKQKLKNEGASLLETHELLEMLLYYCTPLKNTNERAHELLNSYGSLKLLIEADPNDLERRCHVTEHVALFFLLLNEIIKRCNQERWTERMLLDSSDLVGQFAVSLLAYERRECFYVINLDSQKRLIHSSLISKGTIDESEVYLRLVMESVLRYDASSIILAHNHPGGSVKPSFADINTTNRIIKLMNMINVEVVDHIIVSNGSYASMTEMGLIKNAIKN